MANITLMGASYTDVPAVTLPQTGGGTVTFYENGGGTTWETVFSQNVQIVSSSPNYVWVDNYTEPFSANETYRVTWGSNTYTCQTIQDTNNITYDGYYIGDMEAAGYSSTGNHEPFMIYRYKNAANVLVAATTTAAGTIFLKLERQVSSGGSTLITKSITANGTYDATDDDADGYSSVTVNVPVSSASVDTKTATLSAVSQSIEFTSMKGTPKYWFLRTTTQISSSGSTTIYYIIDARYNGTNTTGNSFRIGSTRRIYNVTSGISYSHSGTTLTITGGSSTGSSPGQFYNGTYELVYVY